MQLIETVWCNVVKFHRIPLEITNDMIKAFLSIIVRLANVLHLSFLGNLKISP